MRYIILIELLNSFFIIARTSQILETNSNSCDFNQKQWALIKWYFERCTFIEITEIAQNQSHMSPFSNQIISALMSGKMSRHNKLAVVLILLFN